MLRGIDRVVTWPLHAQDGFRTWVTSLPSRLESYSDRTTELPGQRASRARANPSPPPRAHPRRQAARARCHRAPSLPPPHCGPDRAAGWRTLAVIERPRCSHPGPSSKSAAGRRALAVIVCLCPRRCRSATAAKPGGTSGTLVPMISGMISRYSAYT